MRLTIHHSLTDEGDVDLEVARGTPLHEVLACFPKAAAWCGNVALGDEHESGQWPLLAGAVLSAQPRRASVAPVGLHLAAIAGPDAGVIIDLDAETIIGSVPHNGSPPRAVVRDDSIDANHATVFLTPAGALRVRDNGSVNGTGIWSLRGGNFSWRGRRRKATVRVGDVIAVGRTLLEARQRLAPELASAAGTDHRVSLASRRSGERPLRIAGDLRRAVLDTGRLGGLGHRARGSAASPRSGFPDPTRTNGWAGPVFVVGAHAGELARAVILARGRRPPHPVPLDEPWLSWLPPALDSDGPIRIGASPAVTTESGWTILTAATDRTISRIGPVTSTGPVVRVSADIADALARSLAGSLPDLVPKTIHWADAVALVKRQPEDHSRLSVVAGVMADDPASPWTIALGPDSGHTVIAGAAGSGKTTLLATIAGALAIELTPMELQMVVLCAGEAGALEPYLDLPHVRAAASHVRPDAALRIVNSLDSDAVLTVVIADDVDALGPDGRAVIARLEAMVTRGGPRQVHVVMATRRPTAVLTATLRAATGTAIALRTDCASDSVEVIGTHKSASIPVDAQGMAFVRNAGSVAKVHVALPFADGLPRVRRCDVPVAGAQTLAAAARDATSLGTTASRRGLPSRAGLGRPAF